MRLAETGVAVDEEGIVERAGVLGRAQRRAVRECLADIKAGRQMQRLLRLVNAPDLYARVERDALLIYAIQNKYTMAQANDLLLQNDLPPLYRNE